MRRLAHLSDLHFGRADPRLVTALLADLAHHDPDLVVISGDLTQRARTHQFAEARAFLERLDAPVLVVPGNHDIAPLYRPLARLLHPRDRFHRNLPGSLYPTLWQDDAITVIGLDSTRPLRWKSGALRDDHLDHLDTRLATAPAGAIRVVFLHHPPAAACGGHPFATLLGHGVDLVLAGHAHHARIDLITAAGTGSLVLSQASTACSTRRRGDANGYGLIDLGPGWMDVTVVAWTGDRFHPLRHHRFFKSGSTWRRDPS